MSLSCAKLKSENPFQSMKLESEKFIKLFANAEFNKLIKLFEKLNITPSNNPVECKILAAAHFKLGNNRECLTICESIAPALGSEPEFTSIYGAALRKNNNLVEAERIFKQAIQLDESNPILLNNYANVLIDQSKLNEAIKILDDLSKKEPPNLEDVRINLNRALFIKDQNNIGETAKSLLNDETNILADFTDPLYDAFSEDEITLKDTGNLSKTTRSLPNRDLSMEQQELYKLARNLINENPIAAIKECQKLHKAFGISAQLYHIAGDAYIKLRLFGDSEVALMNAQILGSNDPAIFLSLANLAVLRGDHSLGMKWLEIVATHHPDNPHLKTVSKALFPNGVPNHQNPFQINLDQQTPGKIT